MSVSIPTAATRWTVAAVLAVGGLFAVAPDLMAGKDRRMGKPNEVERWGMFEVALEGPASGNPFVDVTLTARFEHEGRKVEAHGFYDGDGIYRLRFMPDALGTWTYLTKSNRPDLDGKTGSFACVAPSRGNHGPVRVHDTYHFAYADGAPHYSVGTTCYAWTHQGRELEEQTLATLRTAPFSKLRMCVFPKAYTYNENEPELYPFERDVRGGWDFTRFNPEFFRHFERRVGDLMNLGIEADIILFHPYDRWGFAKMDSQSDDRYLRYVVARLAAFRNVWWSLANEFDFMAGYQPGDMEKSKNKRMADWDRFFQIVQQHDPYGHLRSIHNGRVWYDHTKPWVTHASVQSGWHVEDFGRAITLREKYGKPVVFDEVVYEGDIDQGWGNLSPQEMVHRFWVGTVAGCYVGHGETYKHPRDILWWSKGGVLHGQSPPRIAFLRKLIEEGPARGLEPVNWGGDVEGAAKGDEYALFYFGRRQPGEHTFHAPAGNRYRADLIDTWEMKITPLPGEFSGAFTLNLPGLTRIPDQGLLVPEAAPSEKLTHLLYSRDPEGRAALYVNGLEAGTAAVPGTLDVWDAGLQLALANELTLDRPWCGTYRMVALYDRALTASEAERRFRAGPSNRPEGTLVLYTFSEHAGDTVRDVSGVGEALDLKISDPSAVSWAKDQGLEVRAPVLIASPGPAGKVTAAVMRSGALTIEAWVTPADDAQTGPARIVTLSRDALWRSFTLGQQAGSYEVRLRTPSTSENGLPGLAAPGPEARRLQERPTLAVRLRKVS